MIHGQYVFGKHKKDLKNIRNFKSIFNKTGIKKVSRAGSAETSLTLSIKVLKKLEKKIDLSKLQGLIFISQRPV